MIVYKVAKAIMVYQMQGRPRPFDSLDCFIIVAVCFIALFSRLWRLGYPNQIIFDEVYFGNFTNSYIKREIYSDIHPPLGKLVMALFAKLTQYPGNINWGKGLGKPYADSETNYVSLRLTPNVFSSFCPPLLYSAMRALSFSHTAALSASFLALFDFTSIVEGKFILSDSLLHFFCCLHVYAFARFLSESSQLHTLIAGFTLGCAVSCKLTALGLIALDGITQLFWIYFNRPSIFKISLRALSLLGPAILVFFGSWMVHFIVLRYKSDEYFSTPETNRKSLISKPDENSEYLGKRVLNHWLISTILEEIITSHRSNMRITQPHPWSSMPQNWPFLRDKYVLFYSDTGDRMIACLGSPTTYWLTSVGLIIAIFAALFRKVDWRTLLWWLGWACSYFPFIAVPRAMYSYHYIVPMFFASLNLAGLIDVALPVTIASCFNTMICFLSVFCYGYFSPWVYGTPCHGCEDTRMWMKQWSMGPLPRVVLDGKEAFNTTLKRATLVF